MREQLVEASWFCLRCRPREDIITSAGNRRHQTSASLTPTDALDLPSNNVINDLYTPSPVGTSTQQPGSAVL